MSTTPRTATVRGLLVGLVCGIAVMLVVGPSPAIGAGNLAGKVAKALKLAKKADKNANAALAASKQPGPPGPTGPSNGYASAPSTPVGWVASSTQTLASVPVTAGSYIVTAPVVADNDDTIALMTFCAIRLAGTQIGSVNFKIGPNGATDHEVVSLTAGGAAAANGTAELRCVPLSGLGTWSSASVTAIKVGSLN